MAAPTRTARFKRRFSGRRRRRPGTAEAFGAHRFRQAFASALAEADPTNPGLAAVILGITEAVVNAQYRKARQVDAARKLREERERIRAIAERAFGMRSG